MSLALVRRKGKMRGGSEGKFGDELLAGEGEYAVVDAVEVSVAEVPVVLEHYAQLSHQGF
jgi:hypothetical protein